VPEPEATTTPAPADTLISAAAELAPVLSRRSEETSKRRVIPRATIEDFHSLQLLRVLQPAQFGGLEADFGTFARTAIELGRGDGSAAWVYAVYVIHTMMLAHFDERAQQDVWGEDGKTLMSASYAPTGTLVADGDGFRLSGRWGFCSGIDHSAWLQLCGMLERAGQRELLMALVPVAEAEVIDDWHVLGLEGTGSKSVTVEDAFVPAHRTVRWVDLLNATTPGAKIHSNPLYQIPVWSIFPYTLATPGIGIAKGAVEQYTEQMRNYRSVRGAELGKLQTIQLKLAEASALVDAAELLALDGIRATMHAARHGLALSRDQRAKNRRNHGYCVSMARRAVELIFASIGGRGLYDSTPMQRRYRDIVALSAHIATNWDIAGAAAGLMMLTDETPDFLY
jgi:alkylation response protein AidB-like acyl-CoA dehydrogenase